MFELLNIQCTAPGQGTSIILTIKTECFERSRTSLLRQSYMKTGLGQPLLSNPPETGSAIRVQCRRWSAFRDNSGVLLISRVTRSCGLLFCVAKSSVPLILIVPGIHEHGTHLKPRHHFSYLAKTSLNGITPPTKPDSPMARIVAPPTRLRRQLHITSTICTTCSLTTSLGLDLDP